MTSILTFIAYSFLISTVTQILFFVFAYVNKTDKLTDLAYGLTFVILVLVLSYISNNYSVISVVLALLVIIWGLRLAAYLFIRIMKIKKDKRFDGIRENLVKFGTFWFFQGITIPIILVPTTIILAKENNFIYVSLIGVFISLFGIIFESVADYQKFVFKNNHKNKWTNVGLWKHSRHPNYFGEMLMWLGIYLAALPYLEGFEYASVVSPLYIIFLLLFVTGVPTLEKRYDKKFKDNQEYEEYKKKTNLLVPFI